MENNKIKIKAELKDKEQKKSSKDLKNSKSRSSNVSLDIMINIEAENINDKKLEQKLRKNISKGKSSKQTDKEKKIKNCLNSEVNTSNNNNYNYRNCNNINIEKLRERLKQTNEHSNKKQNKNPENFIIKNYVPAYEAKDKNPKLDIESLIKLLQCHLCKGIFRDPFTITECNHIYCKACIYQYFNSANNNNSCPICSIDLGSKPLDCLISDHTTASLINILFPEFEAKDNKEMFFSENKKPLLDEKEYFKEDSIIAHLEPWPTTQEDLKIPKISTGNLKIKKSAEIKTLKNFILRKLDIQENLEIEIFYKSQPLNSSHTIDWVLAKLGTSEELIFYYCKKG